MSAAIATLPIPCNHTPATDSAPLLVIYSAPLHISHLQIFFAFPDPLSFLESFPSPKSKENLGGAEIVQSRRPRLFNLGVGFRCVWLWLFSVRLAECARRTCAGARAVRTVRAVQGA